MWLLRLQARGATSLTSWTKAVTIGDYDLVVFVPKAAEKSIAIIDELTLIGVSKELTAPTEPPKLNP